MTQLAARHLRFLRDLFPGDGCLVSPEETLAYAADAGRRRGEPWAVVRPRERDQAVKLLAWAQAERVPVITRGRATNVVSGCSPIIPVGAAEAVALEGKGGPGAQSCGGIVNGSGITPGSERRPGGCPAGWTGGGVVVSTLWLDRVIEINGEDFVAVVEPGVVTGELQERLGRERLFYPPDPASVRISTVGGNVSTNAGGMRAVKYGVTKDYVLGLEAVLPGGRVVRTGGRTHKNAVGLDLTRLFVGSEGTLGFITEITLKLLPLPEASATLLAAFDSLDGALDGARTVFQAGVLPASMELMAEETLACLARYEPAHPLPWSGEAKAVLLLRLDGSRAALPGELARLRGLMDGALALAEAATPAEEERLWEIRRQINPASFRVAADKLSDDVTVPRSKASALIRGCRDIGGRRGLTILTFGHLGDGNIHVNVMHDASVPGQAQAAAEAKREIAELTLSLGGTLSGEHGVGLSKLPLLGQQLSPEEREIMRSVKRVFDPMNIMNPGKAY